MKLKLTIIDILIIICIICAVGFAVYHMTSDGDEESAVNFDSSTTSKLTENYLNLYKEGYVIKSQVIGTNASSGEKVSINGTVLWVGDEKGSKVKVLIENNGEKYLVGLYKDIPEADIYFDQISLETTGEKYKNIKESKDLSNDKKKSDEFKSNKKEKSEKASRKESFKNTPKRESEQEKQNNEKKPKVLSKEEKLKLDLEKYRVGGNKNKVNVINHNNNIKKS